ncbi:MAG: methyltransferase domain-containing protein [Pseudonocardiaceae bacterium]
MTTITVADWPVRAQFLAEKLVADGDLHSPPWKSAVCAVPRHEFIPHYYRHDTSTRPATWQLVTPHDPSDVQAWLELVYSDTTLITAVADYAERGVQIPVSSSSKPDLMVRMLEELDVADGHRVLEIGTGTGYNAALLSHRLGSQNVFSVDVDPALVATARPRLARLGYHPTLAAVDGATGLVEHAPYDRIIATCSVPVIPSAWIDQLASGGRILADVEGPLGAGNLVTLHKPSAVPVVEGRFLPWWGRFMRLRPQAGPTVGAPRPRRAPGEPQSATTAVDPAELDTEFRFLAQLFLPSGTLQSLTPSPDLTRPIATCLVTPDGSWCEVDRDPGPDGSYQLTFGGPQPLWDGVTAAWRQWTRHGRPAWSQFGLTATPEHHTIWLRNSTSGPSWLLPTPG